VSDWINGRIGFEKKQRNTKAGQKPGICVCFIISGENSRTTFIPLKFQFSSV
jgi:hypothetical protein